MAVSLSPGAAQLTLGSTQQFEVTNGNSSATSFTWMVNGIGGGNSAVGTISSTGLYTAPAVNPGSNAISVTATSGSFTASASITLTNPPALTISPSSARLVLGGVQQFTSSDPNVTWSVNGIAGGGATVGTISSTGLYTAPALLPMARSVSIVASSTKDMSTGVATVGLATLATGPFAYVASAVDDSIQTFVADSATGMLQARSVYSMGAGKGPTTLVLAPNGKFLFSLNRSSNDISILAIDPSTGDLSDAGTVSAPSGPNAMVFSATGNHAYVSCDSASTIEAYTLNLSTGALNPLVGASYVAGSGRIQGLSISPDGKFLYAVNQDANQVIGLAINPMDGSLSSIGGSPFAVQAGVLSIMASDMYGFASGDFGGSGGVLVYARDKSLGGLTLLTQQPQASGGQGPLLLWSSSDTVGGVNSTSSGVFVFGYNSSKGSLSGPSGTTDGSPIASGYVVATGIDYWVYVLNRKASGSPTTGSITVKRYDWWDGLINHETTLPTTLHDPTGFAITP
jgi:6-phosphogluconolactonase (cycloisomerase 2 family)